MLVKRDITSSDTSMYPSGNFVPLMNSANSNEFLMEKTNLLEIVLVNNRCRNLAIL
ncbi:hypothetical protein M0804_015594 [Polistes exclamans]|nr:hypothetical protein M0804_015594 [Polistes exclamans]